MKRRLKVGVGVVEGMPVAVWRGKEQVGERKSVLSPSHDHDKVEISTVHAQLGTACPKGGRWWGGMLGCRKTWHAMHRGWQQKGLPSCPTCLMEQAAQGLPEREELCCPAVNLVFDD